VTTTDQLELAKAAPDENAGSTASIPDPRRWFALATIALAQLAIVLDATIVNVALPRIQQNLHISNADRQWVVTAYALAFGSLLLLGGRIADYTGRKRAFIIGLLGFAGASALGGFATGAGMLFAARGLQGAFGALMAPAALSLLTVTFTEPKERAKAFGVYGAIAGAGGAVGLLLGGALTQYANWRWTLFVNIPIALIAMFAAFRFLNESRAEGNTKYDIPGAIASTGGLVALVYGFTKAETDGWSSGVTIGFLVGAVVLLTAFFVIEYRSKNPLLPMRVIIDRNRGGSFLASLLVGVGLFGVFLFLTYYMQGILGYSPMKTGVAFLPFTVGIIAGAGISSNLLPKVGPRVIMGTGLLISAVGMVLLTLIGVDTSFLTHVLPSELLISFGLGLTFVPMSSTALVGVANHDAGVASALINTTQQVGGSLGTALLNTIAGSATATYIAAHLTSGKPTQLVQGEGLVHGFTVAFTWSAALILLASAVSFLLIKASKNDIATGDGAPVHVG
jgi:EmrB/QacA subfamily drug resistance transporter